MPRNVEETRENMKKRGLHNQSLLSQPPFDITCQVRRCHEYNHHAARGAPTTTFHCEYTSRKDYDGPALPIMLYFHGGFWCAGDANAEDFGCRAIIARETEIIIASFEYRLVPETPWQDVLLDAEHAMKWTAANAASLGGDVGKGFIVGGATSGSHLAAVCAIRARNRYPDIKLTGQLLIVPTTLAWA